MGKKKKVSKRIFACFLCKKYFRKQDIFSVTLERDVFLGETGILQHQENKVKICRNCLFSSGYLSSKKEKKIEEGLLADKDKIKLSLRRVLKESREQLK